MLLVPVVDKYLFFGFEIFSKLKLLLVGFLVYVIRHFGVHNLAFLFNKKNKN